MSRQDAIAALCCYWVLRNDSDYMRDFLRNLIRIARGQATQSDARAARREDRALYRATLAQLTRESRYDPTARAWLERHGERHV